MNKKFTLSGQGCGTAEVKKTAAGNLVRINLKHARQLAAGENFICFVLSDGKLLPLGTMHECSKDFKINELKIYAVSVARQNKITGTCSMEMWGGECVNKDDFVAPCANLKKIEKPVKYAKDEFSFENFFDMDFSWGKIAGYVIPYSYKILKFVLSSENVYQCVNSSGHYMLGETHDSIAVAVPLKNSQLRVFEQFSDKTYIIKDGNLKYKTVCMGIDKSGEFFVHF